MKVSQDVKINILDFTWVNNKLHGNEGFMDLNVNVNDEKFFNEVEE